MRTACSILLGAALGAAAPSLSAGSGCEVLIDCPVLNPEQRASVEARSLAELQLKQIVSGLLQLSCSSERARVEFRAPGRRDAVRSVRLAEPSTLVVEQLVALADWATRDVDTSPSAFQEREVGHDIASTGSGWSPPPALSAPPGTLLGGSLSPTPQRAKGSAELPPLDRSREALITIDVGLGISSELWATEVLGAVGPRVSARVGNSDGLRVGGFGSLEWAAQHPGGASIGLQRAGIEGAWRVSKPIWIVAGASVTRLAIDAPTGSVPPSRSSVELAFLLRPEFVVELGEFQGALGPSFSLYRQRKVIALDRVRVFSVPAIVVVDAAAVAALAVSAPAPL